MLEEEWESEDEDELRAWGARVGCGERDAWSREACSVSSIGPWQREVPGSMVEVEVVVGARYGRVAEKAVGQTSVSQVGRCGYLGLAVRYVARKVRTS